MTEELPKVVFLPSYDAAHDDGAEIEKEEAKLSAFQLKERRERTVFVGNVPLDTTRKYLEKLFGKHGRVDKVWFRSLALDHDSKVPQKAKIITKQFGQQKDNKNAYVLYSKKEEALKASQELNQVVVGDKHIRVDLDGKADEERNDFETTIFIGNLPWVINEEELRAHFEDCGKILNVRVIRDKDTFIGKGIAYIQFSAAAEMKKAQDTKNSTLFKGRQLRVKRATPTERRDKKQDKKRDLKERYKEEKREKHGKHKHSRKVREEEENKQTDKEIKKVTPFLEGTKKGMTTTNENINYSSKIAVKSKKSKQRMQEELVDSIDKKTSRVQMFANKVLKPQPTMNQMLKTKREKRKKLNMQKYTKIKIKKA